MRKSPRRVSSGVVHQDAGVGTVGHVHEHVVAVAEVSVLEMRSFGLVVDHQVGQQGVESQDFRRQGHAPQLETNTRDC